MRIIRGCIGRPNLLSGVTKPAVVPASAQAFLSSVDGLGVPVLRCKTVMTEATALATSERLLGMIIVLFVFARLLKAET